MSYSNVVKAALNMSGKKQTEVAAALGISVQALRNKLVRNSFSCADLVTIAVVCGFDLAFTDQGGRAVVKFQKDQTTE